MKIKDLKNYIAGLDDNAEFVVSSDEELNTIMGKWEVAELEGERMETYCIYGLSGSEIELNIEDEMGKMCDNKNCKRAITDLDYANGGGLCGSCRK